MEPVEAQFILNPKEDEDAAGDADGKAHNVYH
jgi:hypothetical protein